jgi:hypothetical protein
MWVSQVHMGTIDVTELQQLLTGGWGTGRTLHSPLPWLTDKQWSDISRLSALPVYAGLAESFVADEVSMWGPGKVDFASD